MLALAVLALSLAARVSAHATWQEIWINGVDFGGSCVRLPLSNNPVTDVTSDDLICNQTPTSSPNICPVPAGATVTVEMHQQPGDRSCANQAIGGDHYGPMQIYMAAVSNAATASATGLGWFKITEMGLLSNDSDYWATEVLNDNCGHFTFTIPSSIPSGNYLLRAETLALHVASTVGGAQFYMSCFQISVTGGGSASPATVAIPGAYSAQDPGILIDIYTQLNAYTIPGPTVYNAPSPAVATTAWPTTATWNTANQPATDFTTMPGAAPTGGSTGGSQPTTITTTTSSPTTSPQSTPTTTSTPPAGGGGGTVAKYGQCGGQGYTGPTTCAAGSTCTVSNPYYSQCL